MSESNCASEPQAPDIGLMLRAHAELSCLSHEVIPVLRQIETRRDLPDEQLGAALAYLEVTWLEARKRASETDDAHAMLGVGGASRDADEALSSNACRYHAAVKRVRDTVAARIARLLASTEVAQALPSVGSRE